jgi:hypothetical protein
MSSWDNDAEANEIVRREAARRGISETMYRMLKVGPTDVVQDIVRDHVGRADVTRPSSMASTPERSAPKRGTGWYDPKPLTTPPGVEHIDRMVEAATAKERMQSILEAIDADEAIKRAAAQRKKKD